MQEFRTGETINNRYKVIRKLGAGAMGSVYLCEDQVESNIKVALKVLISENLDDQDVWAKGEYEALTRLRHPNLARVYNFGKIADTKDYFIVSEFIKGIDLYTATEYVHYDELNDIIVQICRALEYIHSQGYVHFDIKPDNILVTRHKTIGLKDGSKMQIADEGGNQQNRSIFSKPSVKLIDFGLAEKITGSFNFAIKGTLNYLAPEIINGSTPDKRADLYSLGVTLFQITNRDLPFYQDPNLTNTIRGQKRSELFESHMKKQPEYLRGLIMKLLEERTEDRFQTAKDVIQFISKNSGQHYDVETKETQASYLYCPKLVGRKKELQTLKELFQRLFAAQTTRGEKPTPAEKIPPTEKITAEKRPAEKPAAPKAAAEESGPESAPWAEARAVDPSAASDGNEDGVAGLPSATAEEDDASDDLPLPAASGPVGPAVPPLAVVSGEMGVGKSRLLEEFHHFLKLNGIALYTGNCYEGKSNAYQPFVEILRHMVIDLGLQSEIYNRYQAPILKLLPELAKKDAPAAEASSHPHLEKASFIDRITHFFLEFADRTPFVLTINNLHWGDAVTVDLLEAMVDRICERETAGKPVKIMLLVSQRIDDCNLESLKGLISRSKEIGRCVEILLRRLKRAHLVEILQTILNLNELPAPFLDRLEEKTGGNPLFIMETLKTLQDEGIIKNTGTGWAIKATNSNRIEIPHSLEDLLIKRAQRLEPVKREVLEMMSVINKPISPKVLSRFERFLDLPILVHLRELEDAGLVSKLFEGGKLQFQIDQPKMQEILYAHLEPEARSKCHGDVGTVLAELYRGHEEEVLEELAYHFQRSDQTDRALDLAVRAGDRLKAIYANDRAYEYYLYIIEKTEGDPARRPLWLETHEKLGDLCTTMGKYDVAEHSYDSLLQPEGREKQGPEPVSRAWRKKGKVFELQGDYDNALKAYKEARNFISQYPDENLSEERTRIFNCIGWVYVCMGKYEKAMAISLEGLRMIKGSVGKIEHAMIFNTIGSANYYKGNIVQAIEYHSRSLKIRENLENIPEVTSSLNSLGSAYLANAEYGEAYEHFKRSLAASEEIGDPYGKAMTQHYLARLHFDVGQGKEAEELLKESLRLSRNFNMRHLNMQNYILLGSILRERGEGAKAEGNLFRALTAYSKQGNRWGLCTVLLEIVEVHRQRRNYSEAMSMAEEAHRYSCDLDIDYLRGLSLLAKARLLRDTSQRELDKPLSVLAEAISVTAKVENPEIPGQIHYETAEVLVRARRLRDAQERYRLAGENFRVVMDRLPKEFRASYKEKHKEKLSAHEDVPLAAEVPSPATEKAAPADLAPPAPAGPPASGDLLRRMGELTKSLGAQPPLGAFLVQLLTDLVQVTQARTGFILERRGDNLHLLASADPEGRPVREISRYITLFTVEQALNAQTPVINNTETVFPFLAAKNLHGVVYLEKPGLPADAAGLPVYQTFLNLVPLAFMTLAAAPQPPPSKHSEATEVKAEEVTG